MDSAEAPVAMSLGGRLLNVFAAPGELFAAVAGAPFSLANWLVPAALVALISLALNLAIFTQPALVQQVRDLQERELVRAVDSGRISAADAERARDVMQGMGMTVARVGGAVGGVVVAVLSPLWWGLILWLTARWVFRSPLPYLRVVEVAGLASLIGGLGICVSLFLAVGTGNLFAGPHLGALVKDFDLGNRWHLALSIVNPFSVWQMVVMALGLARWVGRPATPVVVVVGGVWFGYKAIAVILGLGQLVM